MPINAEILKAHLNPLFVETGTYLGEGVEAAVEVGFSKIWTVDLDDDNQWDAVTSPVANKNVVYESGDSALFLAKLVPTLGSPATFWLDAHPVGYFKLLQPDLPLINELLAISFHPRKPEECILIDDIRLFSEEDRDRLRDFVHLLWPDCITDMIDSALLPLDILRVRNMAPTYV